MYQLFGGSIEAFNTTILDAIIFSNACENGLLPLYSDILHQGSCLGTPRGRIFIYPEGIPLCIQEQDNNDWEVIEYDSLFQIRKARDRSGLIRKDTLVTCLTRNYLIRAFFLPWHAVDSTLKSSIGASAFPSYCPDGLRNRARRSNNNGAAPTDSKGRIMIFSKD